MSLLAVLGVSSVESSVPLEFDLILKLKQGCQAMNYHVNCI